MAHRHFRQVWKGCRVLSAGCRKQRFALARRLSRRATRWAAIVGLGMAIAACPQTPPDGPPTAPSTSTSYSSLGRALDACGNEIASTLLQPRSQLQIQDFESQSDGSLTLRWRLNPTREVVCQVSSTGEVLSIQERTAQAEPEDAEKPLEPQEPQEPVETVEFSDEIRPRRIVRRESVEVVNIPAPRQPQAPSRPKPSPVPDRPVRPSRPPQVAVLTASDPSIQINIYSQPSFQSGSPHYGLAGDRITLLNETTGDDGYLWYYVRFDSGAEGWVRSDFVSFSVIPTPPRFPDAALLSCEDRILAELPSLSKDYVFVFPDGNSGDTFYMKWQVSTGAYGVCTSDRFGNLLDYVNLNQQAQPLEPPPQEEGL